MAFAVARTVALAGLAGHVVEVEVHLTSGLPAFTLIGLPDAALSEARDRVRAAVLNSGQRWPQHRVTVNLCPATLPKRGSSFDLAIAAAVLLAAGELPARALDATVLMGELGLDGRLRPVRGVLPAVAAAAAAGVARVIVPEAGAAEARLVPGIEVLGLRSLRQLVALVRGEPVPDDPPVNAGDGPVEPESDPGDRDLADVLGQPFARWVLEVAATGGHHLLLLGSPGAGKTMLAERLPGLLPDLDIETALEVTAIHSVAGALAPGAALVTRPPYRAPHHTATVAAVVGGGSGLPRPGAASLAHRGVLFLDEAPEFRRGVLDALREPLESGTIALARAGGGARYPARFRLVLAANPCPCGFSRTPGSGCTCSPMLQRRYLDRLSGPLLDRIDIRLTLQPVRRVAIAGDDGGAGSAEVAARVALAADRALQRYAGTPWRYNADVPGPVLRRRWPAGPAAMRLLEVHLARGALSMRGADRSLRVAWTVADMAGRPVPGTEDITVALELRGAEGTAAA